MNVLVQLRISSFKKVIRIPLYMGEEKQSMSLLKSCYELLEKL